MKRPIFTPPRMWMWKCFTVVAESGPVFTTVRKPDSRTPLISATENFLGHTVAHVVVVLLRHEQRVHGCLGLDVVEREADVIFIDLVRGDFPGNEFAEQAIVSHVGSFR